MPNKIFKKCKCKYCDQTFAYPGQLGAHYMKRHPESPQAKNLVGGGKKAAAAKALNAMPDATRALASTLSFRDLQAMFRLKNTRVERLKKQLDSAKAKVFRIEDELRRELGQTNLERTLNNGQEK